MSIADPDLRKAQMELSRRAFWRGAKKGTTSGGPTDTKPEDAKPKPLRADVQTEVDGALKLAGIKPEFAAAAAKKVQGVSSEE